MALLLTNITFGQTVNLTKSKIEKYVKSIDRLKSENKLVKVSYPEMVDCGGGVDGYYLNEKLVLIDAIHWGELGFIGRTFYLDQDNFLKIIYREYLPEWEKYVQKYPTDKYEYDPKKMTYTDTIYSITLTIPTIFYKKADKKIISHKSNQIMIDELIDCGRETKFYLQEIIRQVDSLKFVEQMPYICENGICGDDFYWEVVKLSHNVIELLIDKLNDTTSTVAKAALFGYNYTVADIAFAALTEIIHDIPTFELLGVPFDTDGCGYCSYWQHLNENFANRQEFKFAVRKWYHKNKNNLTWVKSNIFATCDCRGKHPNDGHYKLKTDK